MAPRTATPHEAPPGNPLARWARQGVESFVAAQKIVLDLTAQQNALVIGMIRERLSDRRYWPGVAFAKMADKGVENFAAAGKILLDLAAGETAVVVDGLKKGLSLPVAAGALADVVRHRVDTFVGLEKELLKAAAEQAHTVAESYREGKGPGAIAGLTELARRGVEGFVETEKKFLDLASEEVVGVLKGGKEVHEPSDRPKVLARLAREGVEKYIDAQKGLLELAIEQFEPKREAEHPEARRRPHTSFAELTEKSVRNIVTAQKSLMDLAVKPLKASAETRKHPGRPVRRKRARLEPQAAA
jgi:hypothetical protein